MEDGRSLTTARAVLRALDVLLSAGGGLTVSEVAERLGRSVYTSRYLLNSLCQERFAVRTGSLYFVSPELARQGRGDAGVVLAGRAHDALVELAQVTRQRSYLFPAKPGDEVVDIVGHQGQPILPGVGPWIGNELHALAIGKVVLASWPEEVTAAYLKDRGPAVFTPATVVDPDRLRVELMKVRAKGYAEDLEERVEGFSCIAAPVFDDQGRLVAAIGVSTTSKTYAKNAPQLVKAVTEVARLASAGAGSSS